MSIFKDMLKSGESLFRDEIALDYDYLPKLLPYREKEQFYIAGCIKPLLQKRNGKNLFIHGAPGIGKTAATRHILRDLENETDDVIPIYINCWKKNTTYKIVLEICDIIGYKFTQNKKTEELFEIIKQMLNKKSAVFVFDEADKLEDFDFLYHILEEIYRKSVFLITNFKNWILNLDERVRSRLTAELKEFKPYNAEETKGILKKRLSYAFVPGVWENDAFELVAKRTAEISDIRSGLYLMKESALAAEEKSSKKIIIEHVQIAIQKLDDFSIKEKSDLDQESRNILELIKNNSNKKIGELFDTYRRYNGKLSYKSFQRKISNLQKNNFISVEKTEGGLEGNTTIIKYSEEKKLTDF
ncbi:AAA family ATPase [Candidatus Woesearchaeota archaeon]|nr:AAA family ATPase [Candidatus Woesearchaeota archaeon]